MPVVIKGWCEKPASDIARHEILAPCAVDDPRPAQPSGSEGIVRKLSGLSIYMSRQSCSRGPVNGQSLPPSPQGPFQHHHSSFTPAPCPVGGGIERGVSRLGLNSTQQCLTSSSAHADVPRASDMDQWELERGRLGVLVVRTSNASEARMNDNDEQPCSPFSDSDSDVEDDNADDAADGMDLEEPSSSSPSWHCRRGQAQARLFARSPPTVLGMRKGLSRHYGGKSRSFTSLADAFEYQMKDIAKPDYGRRRRSCSGGDRQMSPSGRHSRLLPLRKWEGSITKRTVLGGGKSTLALGISMIAEGVRAAQVSDLSPLQKQCIDHTAMDNHFLVSFDHSPSSFSEGSGPLWKLATEQRADSMAVAQRPAPMQMRSQSLADLRQALEGVDEMSGSRGGNLALVV